MGIFGTISTLGIRVLGVRLEIILVKDSVVEVGLDKKVRIDDQRKLLVPLRSLGTKVRDIC